MAPLMRGVCVYVCVFVRVLACVCVFVLTPFIIQGLLLCGPNSQAADFVLGFQLVI